MEEIIQLLENTGKTKIEFKPNGLRFKDEGEFIGFVNRVYKIRETWFFNIGDFDDNWNTQTPPQNALKVIKAQLLSNENLASNTV